MEPLTAESAFQALEAAYQADEAAKHGAPTEAQVTPPSEGQESNQSEDKPTGLFYDVDPETLTPELRRVFDGMQASFTQKSQDFSSRAKEWESLGDPAQVKQAVEWVNSLNDPQNLVQLHTELSDYLQEAGYTKAQADDAAASAIQDTSQTENQEQDYGFADPEVARLQQQVDDLSKWKSNFEQEQEQHRIENALERTQIQLQQDRGYDEKAIERIYQLSYAYGADLVAAADAYDQMRNDFIASYVSTKAEAPSAASAPITSTTFGQIPESFGSDMNAAHAFAKDKILAMAREGAFD